MDQANAIERVMNEADEAVKNNLSPDKQPAVVPAVVPAVKPHLAIGRQWSRSKRPFRSDCRLAGSG